MRTFSRKIKEFNFFNAIFSETYKRVLITVCLCFSPLQNALPKVNSKIFLRNQSNRQITNFIYVGSTNFGTLYESRYLMNRAIQPTDAIGQWYFPREREGHPIRFKIVSLVRPHNEILSVYAFKS